MSSAVSAAASITAPAASAIDPLGIVRGVASTAPTKSRVSSGAARSISRVKISCRQSMSWSPRSAQAGLRVHGLHGDLVVRGGPVALRVALLVADRLEDRQLQLRVRQAHRHAQPRQAGRPWPAQHVPGHDLGAELGAGLAGPGGEGRHRRPGVDHGRLARHRARDAAPEQVRVDEQGARRGHQPQPLPEPVGQGPHRRVDAVPGAVRAPVPGEFGDGRRDVVRVRGAALRELLIGLAHGEPGGRGRRGRHQKYDHEYHPDAETHSSHIR
ncbi:hypothetical protein ACFQX7_12660 [Luedemannella flava]